MIINNPWVGYLTRSATTIKVSVIARLKIAVAEITDFTDSNILIVILDIFSGIAEMLNYYIDNIARETFITTVRRYSSMLNITQLIDYRVRSAWGYMVDITLLFLDTDGNPITTNGDFTIPKDTKFTIKGLTYTTLQDYIVPTGNIGCNLPVQQLSSKVTGSLLGMGDGTINQRYILPSNYQDGSLETQSPNGTLWTLRDTLAFSGPTDLDFIVNISSVDGLPYLCFGDNVNGQAPSPGDQVLGSYYTTEGSNGKVSAGSTVVLSSALALPSNVISVNYTLLNDATSGKDIEDIEDIREKAPLSLRTLDRAVTKQDFIDIAKLAPGMGKANLTAACGEAVQIYIYPWGGGIPNSTFLTQVKDFVQDRDIINIILNTNPAGETYIVPTIEVIAKEGADLTQCLLDVTGALKNFYSPFNSDINLPVRSSDMIVVIKLLPRVSYLNNFKFGLVPFPRPNTSITPILNWVVSSNNPVGETVYKIVFNLDSGTYVDSTFTILKNNWVLGNFNFDVPYNYNLGELAFQISSSNNPSIPSGSYWTFKVYPNSWDIALDDFSVPIAKDPYLSNIIVKAYQ